MVKKTTAKGSKHNWLDGLNVKIKATRREFKRAETYVSLIKG